MSIELDFIKRYGPPKYRIKHKLRFQDEELYVVQEKPSSDQELMNERLSRDTFARATKLYPRQGPWAEPIRCKIVNNYPAFRQKTGKEVRLITKRVYRPTYSHAQRSKGDFDPDVQCPPHQKRMSYSSTYWQRKGQSTEPQEDAAVRPYTSCSRASKYRSKSRNEEKPRPKSCPPSKQKKESKPKSKDPNVDNSRRRSLFNLLTDGFSEDLDDSDEESSKSTDESVKRKIYFDGKESDTISDTLSDGSQETASGGLDGTTIDSNSDDETGNGHTDEKPENVASNQEDGSEDLGNTDTSRDESVERSEEDTYPEEQDDTKSERSYSYTSEDDRKETDSTENAENFRARSRTSMRSTSSKSSVSSRSSSESSRSRDSSLDSVIDKRENITASGAGDLNDTKECDQNSDTTEYTKDTFSETSDHDRESNKAESRSQSSLGSQTGSQVSIKRNNTRQEFDNETNSASGSRSSVQSNITSGSRGDSNLGSSASIKSRNSSQADGRKSTLRSRSAVSVKSQHSQKSRVSQSTGSSQTSTTSTKRNSKSSTSNASDRTSHGSRRSSKKESGSETSLRGSPYNVSVPPAKNTRSTSRSSLKSTANSHKDSGDNKSIKSNRSYRSENKYSAEKESVTSWSSENKRDQLQNVTHLDQNTSVTSLKEEQAKDKSVEDDTKSQSSSESDHSSVVSVIERNTTKNKDGICQDDNNIDNEQPNSQTAEGNDTTEKQDCITDTDITDTSNTSIHEVNETDHEDPKSTDGNHDANKGEELICEKEPTTEELCLKNETDDSECDDEHNSVADISSSESDRSSAVSVIERNIIKNKDEIYQDDNNIDNEQPNSPTAARKDATEKQDRITDTEKNDITDVSNTLIHELNEADREDLKSTDGGHDANNGEELIFEKEPTTEDLRHKNETDNSKCDDKHNSDADISHKKDDDKQMQATNTTLDAGSTISTDSRLRHRNGLDEDVINGNVPETQEDSDTAVGALSEEKSNLSLKDEEINYPLTDMAVTQSS